MIHEYEHPAVAKLREWFPAVEFQYRPGVLKVTIDRGRMRFLKDFHIDSMAPEQVLPVVSRHIVVFSRPGIESQV